MCCWSGNIGSPRPGQGVVLVIKPWWRPRKAWLPEYYWPCDPAVCFDDNPWTPSYKEWGCLSRIRRLPRCAMVFFAATRSGPGASAERTRRTRDCGGRFTIRCVPRAPNGDSRTEGTLREIRRRERRTPFVILNKTDRRIEGAAERLGVKPTTPLSLG